MLRKIVIVALVLMALTGTVMAGPPELFAKGGWEFGGNFMYTLMPSYPIFGSDYTEDQTGDYFQIADFGMTAGIFLMDGFSLSLHPTVLWTSRHSINALSQESKEPDMELGIAIEPRCYFSLGQSMTLSLAGALGVSMIPGLKQLDSDVIEEDNSLDFIFSLEPKAAFYFHIAANAAPFMEIGYKLLYYWDVKNMNGDKVVYPADYSLIEDIYGRLHVTLGLKFFFPAGSRFGDKRGITFAEIYDSGMIN